MFCQVSSYYYPHLTDEYLDIHRDGSGTLLQYSCLENSMDGGAWWAVVHGVTKSWTQMRDFTFTFHFHALEKEMATHSSILAWRIPGMGEPGGLPIMGPHRVRHDWSDLEQHLDTQKQLSKIILKVRLKIKLSNPKSNILSKTVHFLH